MIYGSAVYSEKKPNQRYSVSGKDPLPNAQAYEGVKATNPPNLIKSVRAPTTNDTKYPIGTLWINTTTSTSYQLVKAPGVWAILGTNTGGDIQTLTGDTGGALLPTLGNMNILGTAAQIAVTGAGSTLTLSLTGPYTPATFTNHALLVGSGAASIRALTVATTGQVVTGATGADPNFVTAGTNGQLFIGSTGAQPAFATVSTSTGVAFTTGAGTLAIDVKTGGFAVIDQNSSTATVAVQTLYVIDNSSTLVTLTLPATAVQGSTFRVVGSSVGGWKIAQNASQQIVGVGVNTTSGTGGSLSSTSKNDCVELIASTGGASTIWTIASFSGSLTFV